MSQIPSQKNKDTDFMSELDAAAHMRPAMPAILMMLTIMAMFTFVIIWASKSEIEELTRAQGQVVPSQDIQIVQSLEGGVLEDILVTEGEQVTQGQILLRVSDVQFASKERGTEAKFMALQAQKARLRAEINSAPFSAASNITDKYPQIVANERALYNSRMKELRGAHQILDDRAAKAQAEMNEADAQINRLSDSAASLQEELRITQDLVKTRAVPKLEALRLERELNDTRGQINAQQERKRALQAEKRGALNEKKNITDRYRSEALSELSNVETQLSALQEELTSIGDRVQRTEIKSPADGIINRIAVKTIGGVVEPAKPLAEIVPLSDALKIVAKVTPEDIAFLRLGMKAKVKITAYDAQKYGSVDATLSRIGANSISDGQGNVYFEIEVKASKNYLGTEENKLPIMPGMVAAVDIITGKRTILYYLLKPLMRARESIFTER